MHSLSDRRADVTPHPINNFPTNVLNVQNRGGGDGLVPGNSIPNPVQYSGPCRINPNYDRNEFVRQLWRQQPIHCLHRTNIVGSAPQTPLQPQYGVINYSRMDVQPPQPPLPQPPPPQYFANVDYRRGYVPPIEVPNLQPIPPATQPNPYYTVNYPYPPGYFPHADMRSYPPNPQASASSQPLVFGPPPRDRRSQDCPKYTESIPVQSIFQSFSNLQMDDCNSCKPASFMSASSLEALHILPMSDDLELNTSAGRSNIKLKFSKNVVNIPKKIESMEHINSGSCGDLGMKNSGTEVNEDLLNWQIRNSSLYQKEEKTFPSTLNTFDMEDYGPSRFLLQEESAFIDMIVEGCIHGEEIATKYQNVPCFKNIKKLCEKTKSDLMTPHCTARNIHSQGIPWATKDYIFAFTRLTSCWYLLKGYLGPQKSDVFDKIEELYSPDLRKSFELWEQSTAKLAFDVMKSFMALGNNNTLKSWNPSAHSTPLLKDLKGEDDSKKYIKPGCYPVPKVDSSIEYLPFKNTPQGIITSAMMKRNREVESDDDYYYSGTKVMRKRREVNEKRELGVTTCAKKAHKSFYNSILSNTPKTHIGDAGKWNVWYSRKKDGLSRLGVQTFEQIVYELWNMTSSHYFVFEVDVRYVPDYYDIIKQPMFLTNILQKLKQNKYNSLNQVVHDFRRIFHNARTYLEVHPDKNLQCLISNFSNAFEQLLAEHLPKMDFSHISGEPNEEINEGKLKSESTSSQEDR